MWIKRLVKFMLQVFLLVAVTLVLALVGSRLVTGLFSLPRTYTVESAPIRRVAIVFGAGLLWDGSPTAILKDRVETAAELYFAGKVEKLLMSGDNRFLNYNEPGAMREYALSLGIPDEAIVLDYAGRRTYDTCYRAKVIFGVEEATLITQGFHLPRSIYTCSALGVPAIGVAAEGRYYLKRSRLIWNLRELGATAIALLDVHLTRPLPVLGEPEPIYPANAR